METLADFHSTSQDVYNNCPPLDRNHVTEGTSPHLAAPCADTPPISRFSNGTTGHKTKQQISTATSSLYSFLGNLRRQRQEAAKALVWSALIAAVSMFFAASTDLLSPACAFGFVLGAWLANAVAIRQILSFADKRTFTRTA
ncbi:MAG: hypothetical protein NXI32_25175 [bacterium]|nr:hypothetical protein [bacterium]